MKFLVKTNDKDIFRLIKMVSDYGYDLYSNRDSSYPWYKILKEWQYLDFFLDNSSPSLMGRVFYSSNDNGFTEGFTIVSASDLMLMIKKKHEIKEVFLFNGQVYHSLKEAEFAVFCDDVLGDILSRKIKTFDEIPEDYKQYVEKIQVEDGKNESVVSVFLTDGSIKSETYKK